MEFLSHTSHIKLLTTILDSTHAEHFNYQKVYQSLSQNMHSSSLNLAQYLGHSRHSTNIC